MMARPLPQWCKNVKIELVRRDMSISDLAKLVGLTKQYTSGMKQMAKMLMEISTISMMSVPASICAGCCRRTPTSANGGLTATSTSR